MKGCIHKSDGKIESEHTSNGKTKLNQQIRMLRLGES